MRRCLPIILTVAVFSLSACGKKEAAGTEAKKAEAKKGEAAKAAGDEAKKDEKAPAADDKGAKGDKAAKLDGAGRVEAAKAMVDKMAVRMKAMVTELESAAGDREKIQALSKKFREFADANKDEGEALSKAMNPEEKKEVSEYAKAKLAPLMSKMMAELMKAMAAGRAGGEVPEGATPPTGDKAPAAAEGAEKAGAAADKPAEKAEKPAAEAK